jgi:hypothetical protein
MTGTFSIQSVMVAISLATLAVYGSPALAQEFAHTSSVLISGGE